MIAANTKIAIPIEPLTRDTLQERVYTQVADLILDGAIAPGQQVTIQGLADAFGVSTMPVREALKRLTAANALTVLSGRSMGIPRLNLDRLTDLRNVRLELEGAATEWAARSIDDEALARLEQERGRMDQAIGSDRVKDYLRANRAFHFTVYRASGSTTIVELIEVLWLQISPYFNLLRESENYVSSNVHHGRIVAALKRRDGRAACGEMRADIEDAYRTLSMLAL